MANFRFDIQQAFESAFGYSGLMRFPEADKEPVPAPGFSYPAASSAPQESGLFDFSGVQVISEDEAENPISLLGTPIYMPFKTLPGTYKVKENGRVVERRFEGYDFQPTTLLEITRSKEVVKTKINGRNGTVKEYITLNDYDISIKTLLISETGSPLDELQKLKNLCDVPASIPVQGKLFEVLGIFEIVIERDSLAMVEGKRKMIPVSFSCVSDEPVQLKLR